MNEWMDKQINKCKRVEAGKEVFKRGGPVGLRGKKGGGNYEIMKILKNKYILRQEEEQREEVKCRL